MPAMVDPLRSFELRAWARAVLLRECVCASFDEAFAPLWADATRDGLVAQYGSQVLMQIIAGACHQVGLRILEEH
jgi:hypothetical protein